VNITLQGIGVIKKKNRMVVPIWLPATQGEGVVIVGFIAKKKGGGRISIRMKFSKPKLMSLWSFKCLPRWMKLEIWVCQSSEQRIFISIFHVHFLLLWWERVEWEKTWQ